MCALACALEAEGMVHHTTGNYPDIDCEMALDMQRTFCPDLVQVYQPLSQLWGIHIGTSEVPGPMLGAFLRLAKLTLLVRFDADLLLDKHLMDQVLC